MQLFLERFLDDTSGASFLDFSLIAAFISLVVVVVITLFGGDLEKPFEAVTSALTSSVSNP